MQPAIDVADGPRDNAADKVRPVPPPGIEVPAADRAELEKGVTALGQQIDALRGSLKDKPALLGLLPEQVLDIRILGEVFEPAEVSAPGPTWSIPRDWRIPSGAGTENPSRAPTPTGNQPGSREPTIVF